MVGKIVLASSSPRRADIMKRTKLNFEIVPSPYIEDHTTTAFSYDYIENLAYNKAKAVKLDEPALVVGADTVVVLDGEILGKPDGAKGAFEMLKKLSGKTHQVVTSIVVINTETGEVKKKSTTSCVTSYGIQEMPDGYIKSYTGDLENIIGMSSKVLLELIGK